MLYAPPIYLEKLRNKLHSDLFSSFGSDVRSHAETGYSKRTEMRKKSSMRRLGSMANKMQNDEEAMYRKMTLM